MNETQTSPDGDFCTGCSLVHQKRSDSTDISCVSMKSDESIDVPIKFSHGDKSTALSSVHQKRSVSPDISCVSMKSDQSIDVTLKFRTSPAFRPVLTEPVCRKLELKSQDFNEDMCAGFSPKSKLTEVLNIFRSNLKQKFECLCEGTSQKRNPTLLNEIYTDLYITESESGEISNEHEVMQIETQSRRAATEDKPIKCSDIFKPLPAQDKPIRHVLTKGVAGIGKTVSVQKFILDWAEGKENQDIHLIFPLPFRELNLMKNKTLSLLDLLHLFFPEMKEIEISRGEYKVLFIFDGLDECRLHLNFPNNQSLSDVNESASVDVMLNNLMAGNLLPAALIWTTSRPAVADLIPSECVDRVTEVRGFTDKQKEDYFSKRISDESLVNRIISHLKSSRSLYIMCHIPVFCWISATVLERMLGEAESDGEIPKTLTQMYTHFLIIQTNIKHQKDYEKNDREMILKLGKLAFEQLVKGNVIFYDEDLRVCGIDVAEASVYSGLCTQIFREEFGLYRGKVYCFVHLSIQEHLAALYAHLSFTNNNRNVFKPGFFSKILDRIKKEIFLSELHQRAVDKALQSRDGHLDLFLRFLLGLSLESNQNLLRDLLTKMRRCSYKKEETVDYIKHKIKRNLSPDKSINLFHCLSELNDDSLLQEIQHYMTSRSVAQSKLSSSQWSALGFVLLMSEQHLEEFDLSTFVRGQNTADEVLVRLQPVIKESKKLELSWCSITAEGCVALASALRSTPSHLTDLNLSYNNLKDSGVKLMSTVLENPHCKLTSLRLCGCSITAVGCDALVSALRSNPSHLTHLNLSDNNLTDSGLKIISTLLENPQCKLEKLMLERCSITDGGCAALTSALKSNPSHLRELNLSDNSPGNSGVKLISNVLENPHCKLEKLELKKCNITDKGCVALSSALSSNPSHLRHLDLSDNYLMYSGVKLISTFLESPQCKLEKLDLRFCDIKDESRAVLDSAMRINSHLRELYY